MALINCNLRSKVLGEQTNISVILPTRANGRELVGSGEKFRVLYLLHGGSDDCTYYYRNTGIERYATQGNFAVVCPEVRLSFYSDMQYGLRYFTFLSEELPELVEKIFPISSLREDHFVLGNSMGSHGAMKWAFRKPEFFKAAAGMSGVGGLEELGFIPRLQSDEAKNNPIRSSFGSPEEFFESDNDLKFLAKKLVESQKVIPRLFSCCGTEDFTYQACCEFASYAQSIHLPLTFEEGPGAHEWDFWDRWMRYIIRWFGLGEV
jgi:S-formylglutathione hydrolase FrmB